VTLASPTPVVVEAGPRPRPRLWPGETAAVVGLLALVAALSQFLHMRQFGLYEDDYFFIAQAMGKDPSYLVDRLAVFARWTQGRPIGFFLPDLLSFVGDKFGGLTGIYVLGFLVVVLNASLFYLVLRRRQSATVAILGGLGFLLFPADTTKTLLTHDFQLQPSLTFWLLAALAYLAGHRRLPYLVVAGSLITYESPFVVFLGMPLLDTPWSRRTWPALGWNALKLGVVFGLGVLVRLVAGEGRAIGATSGVFSLLPPMLGSMVIGPVRTLELFGYGPLRAVPTWDLEILLLAVGLGLGLFWVLRWLPPEPLPPTLRAVPRSPVGQLFLAGLALLVLAYPLAFTHYPPTAVAGRSTSVHLAATLGGGVLFAAVGAWALSLPRGVGAALVAGYVALLGGYYLTIQRDFVVAWDQQQAFWSQVAACCSDLGDRGVIVVETTEPLGTPMVAANSWADPLVLPLVYRFPPDWRAAPRLFTLGPGWTSRLQRDGAGWRWLVPAATWDEHWEPLPPDGLIVIRSEHGQLLRETTPLTVDGAMLPLADPGPARSWPPGPLYAPLLGGGS
jgi:hypothetical protein